MNTHVPLPALSGTAPFVALDMLGPVLERETGAILQDVAMDTDLASLRHDPRFQAMVAATKARLAAAQAAPTAEGISAPEP